MTTRQENYSGARHFREALTRPNWDPNRAAWYSLHSVEPTQNTRGGNMERTNFGYKLSTGLEIYANEGILGLDEKLRLTEGYDGMVSLNYDEDSDEVIPYTFHERVEIANFMKERWEQFAIGGTDDN